MKISIEFKSINSINYLQKVLLAVLILLFTSIKIYANEKTEIKRLEKEIEIAEGEHLYELKADLSRLYYRYDANKTYSLAKEVLSYAKPEHNSDLEEKAYVRIAIWHYLSGNSDSTLYYCDKALKTNELTNNIEEKEYALNLTSLLYNSIGNYQKAIEYGEQVLKLRRNRNDTIGVAGSLGNLAFTYKNVGNYEKTAEYLYESLDIFEKIGDTISIVGRLQSLYYLKERLKLQQDAFEVLTKAIGLSKKINYPMQLAELYSNLSGYYLNINEYDSALIYEQLALDMFIDLDIERSCAASYLQFANIYDKMGKYKKARSYYYKAMGIYKPMQAVPKLNILYENFGLNFSAENMNDSAEYYFLKAYNSAKKINQARVVQYTAKDLRTFYKKINNYKKSLEYFEIYTHYSDSISGGITKKQIAELDVKYQISQKEKKIALLENQKLEFEIKDVRNKQKQQFYISTIILVVIVLIAFGVFVYFKSKKDKQIQRQKEIVHIREKELANSELEKSKLKEKELNTQLEYKSKQLTSHALNMMKKNKFLHELESDISDIRKEAGEDVKAKLRRVNSLIKRNNKSDKDWELFKNYFEEVNQGFYERLNVKHPGLSSNDYKLCALIKLNMNIKESASVLNISPESVKTARYRLRKKLEMNADQDLHELINMV